MSRTQNRLRSLALTRAIMIVVVVAAAANHAAAEEPLGTAFTYSGELQQGGSPVDDTCDFQFSLWNHPTDTAPENQVGSTLPETVEVGAGRFTASLDFGSNIFTGNARWLQIAVCCPSPCGNFTTLSPRQELTPTPYALFAASGNQGPPGPAGSTSLRGLQEFVELGANFWEAPAGVDRVMVEIWGGSGGGGGAGNSVGRPGPLCVVGGFGGGGGGGGYLRLLVDVVPGETYIVRVGSGGSGAGPGAGGTDGTPTTFEITDDDKTIILASAGAGGGGGGGGPGGAGGAGGAGGSVSPLEGLARPGQDGGIPGLPSIAGNTARGTVSPPQVLLFLSLRGGGGGFPDVTCEAGGPGPGSGGPGDDGYALLHW